MSTNKIDLVRAEVERLKSNLIYGACSSQIAMETRCKEEAYNEVLAILDTMKEEPVYVKNKLNALSDGKQHLGWINDAKVVEFEECLMQFHKDMSNIPQDTDSLIRLKDTDGVLHGYSKKLMSMAKEEPASEQKLSNVERTVKNWKESVSEIDFEQELYKAFGHVKDFTLCLKIAKRFYNMGRNYQEPVSEEWIKELRTKLDSMSKEDFKKVFDKYAVDFNEEPVSEDLEEAGKQYLERSNPDRVHQITNAFKAGAKWQKEKLWKPADGDDLPDIDREVIAILDNGKVVFAHRPPEYWDGKNIITCKVTRNYPKTYDKGGWNIPNVKFWLDVELPKEIEL